MSVVKAEGLEKIYRTTLRTAARACRCTARQLVTDSPLYKGYKSVMLFDGIRPWQFAEEVFRFRRCASTGAG